MTAAAPGRLAGVRVLVTRPTHQAENLCRLIENEGGTAVRLPLLSIEPAGNPADVRRRLAAPQDLWIFTSANAVRHALPLATVGAARQVAAIGPATATALLAAGLSAQLVASGATSEALLDLPELQAVAGRRILIVTGEGGRDRLETGLAARGAQVERAEVYRRVPLPYPPESVLAALRRSDVVALTSGEALEHLARLTPPEGRSLLLRKRLVVPGARVVETARRLGFSGSVTAAEPLSDSAICTACAAANTN